MHNDTFTIRGLANRKRLQGSITVNGAKNAALPALAAAALFKSPVSYQGLPAIEDIKRSEEILEAVGFTRGARSRFSAPRLTQARLPKEASTRMRASIIWTGPLLARYRQVHFPHPGGCVIGPRPIDLFLDAFTRMGASVHRSADVYTLRAPKGLRGTRIFFNQQSVTATETLLFAATLARGTTVIHNAALEPEVSDVGNFLIRSGAHIEGLGTHTIVVRGGTLLSARASYRVMPDRIEAGSLIILGALAARELTITNCIPNHLHALTEFLQAAGVPLVTTKESVRIVHNKAPNNRFRSLSFKTHEYPGFPTDLQAPATVFLSQTRGEATVFETIFENRLNYVEALNTMGAQVRVWNRHEAHITGPTPLKGTVLTSPDIRAGLAFVIAAAIARGTSVIHNAYYIDRGYAQLPERLRSIGLSITRNTHLHESTPH